MAFEEDETCGWPFSEACYSPPADLDAEILRIAKNLTVSTLKTLTLHRMGTCPVTVRPCTSKVCFAGFSPHIGLDGQWVNVCGCRASYLCHCGPVESIRLPGPVGRIDAVWVDGVQLPISAYRVDNGNELVRLDGERWPVTQDMTADIDQAGSFAVTYVNAYVPDDAAAWASAMLLKEFVKACSGDGTCALSPRVTSVARRGVSAEIRDTMLSEGKTNIPVVDAWVATWNPNGLRTAPAIYSPDLPRVRTTTL